MNELKKQLEEIQKNIIKKVSESLHMEDVFVEPRAPQKPTEMLPVDADKLAQLPAGEKLYFSDVPEQDVWGYPYKYAFLGGTGERFIKDTSYLFLKLITRNKMSPAEAAAELYPESKAMEIKSYNDFLNMLTTLFIEMEKRGEYAKIKSFKTPEEIANFLNSEKAKQIMVQNNIFTDEAFKESQINTVREFNRRTQNRAALISFNINPKSDNDPKLRGLGFWQLQFLVRVLMHTPKFPYEEVFTNTERFVGEAKRILYQFYRLALQNQAKNLTGRLHINPNDHEFQIYLENALDHVFDQLFAGAYDISKENFGAWAFTVMKNHIINSIKTQTEEFIQPDAPAVLDNAGYRIIAFVEPLEDTKVKLQGIPSNEIAQTLKDLYLDDSVENPKIKKDDSIKGGFKYIYTFKSGADLGEFLYNNGKNANFIKLLSPDSRRSLRNLKLLYAPKISVGNSSAIEPSIKAADETVEKITDKEKRDAILGKIGRIFQGISNQKFGVTTKGATPIQKETNELKEKYGYSDEELEKAFYRDYGKAVVVLMTQKLQDEYYWDKEPSVEVLNDIIQKYHIDKKVAKNFFNKSGRPNMRVNSAVSDIFYYTPEGSDKKEIYPELLDNFYVKSRWAGIQSGEGTIGNTFARFHNRQQKEWLDEIERAKKATEERGEEVKPEPIYTFKYVANNEKALENFYNRAIKAIERFKLNREKSTAKEKSTDVKSKIEDVSKAQKASLSKEFLYRIISGNISESERVYLTPDEWVDVEKELQEKGNIKKISKIRNDAVLIALKRIDPNFKSGEFTADDLKKWGADYVDKIVQKLKKNLEAKSYYLSYIKNSLYNELSSLRPYANKMTDAYINKKYYKDVADIINTSVSQLTGHNLNILENELKNFKLFINEINNNIFKTTL